MRECGQLARTASINEPKTNSVACSAAPSTDRCFASWFSMQTGSPRSKVLAVSVIIVVSAKTKY